MKPVPILFLTDSPDCPSGLARIGPEQATRVHHHLSKEFRVGYLGRGGLGGNFPFPTWIIPHNLYGLKTSVEWGSTVIEQVWREFAGDEAGVVFSIWDPARMIWLSRPEHLIECPTKDFLMGKPFSLWGYFPVDGHTPAGTLGLMARETLLGYDRVLGYTKYGADVLCKSMGRTLGSVRHLPHGLDPAWAPRDKNYSRDLLGVPHDSITVGVVATNQQRKNWGQAAQIGQELAADPRFRQWWHIDQPEKAWSVQALLNEFGLEKCTIVTFPPKTDEWMTCAYSACDVTLAIGAGEGFGYPIVESQACGTPVIHGNYAGGAELIPPPNRVAFRDGSYVLDGLTNIMRPVYPWIGDWVEKCLHRQKLRVANVAALRWPELWPHWEKWFLEGLR